MNDKRGGRQVLTENRSDHPSRSAFSTTTTTTTAIVQRELQAGNLQVARGSAAMLMNSLHDLAAAPHEEGCDARVVARWLKAARELCADIWAYPLRRGGAQ
jgi:hypothetical protein